MPLIESERYVIEPRPIGRGGFGEVYSAKDLLFDREVVIKTIVASHLYGINEPNVRRQFFKESVICARLGQKSKFVVRVLDYGYDRDSDIPFFVMEHVQGHDLTELIGQLSWQEAARLLDNILAALQVAHENGVVHSDISPDNIMLDQEQSIYRLNDFGLAKLLSSNLMRRGSLKSLTGGKPGYLPPTDWQTGERSEHSDLYSLAMTVTQLLTGKMPLWELRNGSFAPPDALSFFEETTESSLDTVALEIDDDIDTFPLDDTWSRVFFSRHPKKKFWGFQDIRSSASVLLTRENLVNLLDAIIRHNITEVSSAIEHIRSFSLGNLLTKEKKLQPPLSAAENTDYKPYTNRKVLRKLQKLALSNFGVKLTQREIGNILGLMREERKIDAIKEHRKRRGAGLKDSKDLVEYLASEAKAMGVVM